MNDHIERLRAEIARGVTSWTPDAQTKDALIKFRDEVVQPLFEMQAAGEIELAAPHEGHYRFGVWVDKVWLSRMTNDT